MLSPLFALLVSLLFQMLKLVSSGIQSHDVISLTWIVKPFGV